MTAFVDYSFDVPPEILWVLAAPLMGFALMALVGLAVSIGQWFVRATPASGPARTPAHHPNPGVAAPGWSDQTYGRIDLR